MNDESPASIASGKPRFIWSVVAASFGVCGWLIIVPVIDKFFVALSLDMSMLPLMPGVLIVSLFGGDPLDASRVQMFAANFPVYSLVVHLVRLARYQRAGAAHPGVGDTRK